MFVSTYRTIKFALQGFWRNIWLSIVTVIILVLTLFTLSMVGGINVIGNTAIKSIQEKIDVSVYFKPEVKDDEVINVNYRLSNLSQVKEVTYISKDQALEKFKEKHKDNPVIIESLEELAENPLGATLNVKANNINDYPAILSLLEEPDYSSLIQDINFQDNQQVINQLSSITKKVQKIGIIISGIFIVITILIVFNTIRITIYTHREEIGIMKLVGGTNWFVRAPFLLESILYGVFAALICVGIIYPLINVISPQVSNFFEGYNLDLMLYFKQHFWNILGLQLGFAVFLSVISSAVAVGKYLKV